LLVEHPDLAFESAQLLRQIAPVVVAEDGNGDHIFVDGGDILLRA
jgi:hypothetical protein